LRGVPPFLLLREEEEEKTTRRDPGEIARVKMYVGDVWYSDNDDRA
jgi:hypothetical protein